MKGSDDKSNRSTDDDEEYVRLDPAQRRKLKRWIAAVVIAVVLIGLFLKFCFGSQDEIAVMHRMYAMCYVMSVLLFAAAGYLAWYARRIYSAERYPPPGGLLLGDTRILRGNDARIHARWIGLCAIVFAALAVYAAMLPRSIASTPLPASYRLITPQVLGPNG